MELACNSLTQTDKHTNAHSQLFFCCPQMAKTLNNRRFHCIILASATHPFFIYYYDLLFLATIEITDTADVQFNDIDWKCFLSASH